MDNTLQQTVLLLPCYSLEDLTRDRETRDCEEILSGWSALFHPRLLALAGVPKWDRADVHPPAKEGFLFVVPTCSKSLVPDDWVDHAYSEGAVVVASSSEREEMVATLLEHLGEPGPLLDPSLVADFFALGYCHLLVELLTRHLHYMSHLDEMQFEQKATAAAQHALGGEAEAARSQLQAAFDLLTQARESYYATETHLLDLTLVAPSTMGESLRAELASPGPVNLLLSGHTLQQMALDEPDTLAALKKSIKEGTALVLGGEFDECELPLLGLSAILGQFERGLNCYDRYLGERPKIFARRRFGLSPAVSRLLESLGFEGALHFTLDDGRFPVSKQSKFFWQGIDGSTVSALGSLPLDAARHENFLRLPQWLGAAMESDHTATFVFAHWPSRVSPWYRELQRIARFSPAVGRFMLASDFFQATEHSGHNIRYRADQYRSPYLRQSVAAADRDPISRWVRYHRRLAAAEAETSLKAMADLVDGGSPHASPDENLFVAVENSRSDDAAAAGLDDRIASRLDAALARLARGLPRGGASPESGRLLANPAAFARRFVVDVSEMTPPPAVEPPVERVADSAGQTLAVVEVPPMGFAWLGPGDASNPQKPEPVKKAATGTFWKRAKQPPPMAEDDRIRNEFFEILFNPDSGAIQAIYDFANREKKLSQQIAFRFPQSGSRDDEDVELAYSVMAADRLVVASAGPLVAEMECHGRLVDRDGRQGARFKQTTRIRRGSRVIELNIDLEPGQQPGDDPWDSYYAVRFAWGDSTAELYRGAGGSIEPSDASRVEAADFLELRTDKGGTTILTAGLPYHRRFGLRKLDTLLIVRGETARSFRLGLGINLPHPAMAAADFISPRPMLAETAAPPSPGYGWLFHVDVRNVLAGDWTPRYLAGRVSGYRVRLLETEGRHTEVTLRSFRPVATATQTAPGGSDARDLSVEGDRISVSLPPHAWTEVEARFASVL